MLILKTFFSLIAVVAGIEHVAIDFYLDYFLYRNVKLLCVLDCKLGGVGKTAFTKAANSHRMLVTTVDIDASNKSYGEVEKCLEQTMSSVGVVLAAECEATEETLLLASEKLMFDETHIWLIIENIGRSNATAESNVMLTKSVGFLDNLNISVNADIVLATTISLQKYILYEIYNFGRIQGSDLIVNQVGSWKKQTGLNNYDLNCYKYYKRWDFQQWQMRMIFVISPIPRVLDPKVLTDRKPTPGITVITKTASMVLHVIADVHNFRFKYTACDRWIGTYEINSSRVVANSLYFREQDISPVLRYQPNLIDNLDVAYPPLTSIETRYYYRIPTKGPGKFENQFLRPLSKGAWLCVVAVSALCVILLLMSASFERRASSAQYAVFSVVAAICQQFFEDMDDGIKSSAARKVTIFVTGLSCVLIYNYYTSSVVSWLLSGPPPSITSLQELLDSPLELKFEDVGYTRSWLQTPNYYYNRRNAKIEDELRRKKVHKRGYSSSTFVPLEEGIAMVKAGGYAYHTETDRANDIISRTFTQSDLCELGSLQSMEKTHLFTAVQRRSPYKEFLDWSLLRLAERGVVSCIQQRTHSHSVKCEGSSPRALALGGAAPAFILLATGYGVAIIIMLVERVIQENLLKLHQNGEDVVVFKRYTILYTNEKDDHDNAFKTNIILTALVTNGRILKRYLI